MCLLYECFFQLTRNSRERSVAAQGEYFREITWRKKCSFEILHTFYFYILDTTGYTRLGQTHIGLVWGGISRFRQLLLHIKFITKSYRQRFHDCRNCENILTWWTDAHLKCNVSIYPCKLSYLDRSYGSHVQVLAVEDRSDLPWWSQHVGMNRRLFAATSENTPLPGLTADDTVKYLHSIHKGALLNTSIILYMIYWTQLYHYNMQKSVCLSVHPSVSIGLNFEVHIII